MKTNLSAIVTKLSPAGEEVGNTIPFKDMGILDHIEKIVEISKKYGIKKCLYKGKIHLDYVSGKLKISPMQAVLFSHFMEKSNDNRILISEIAESAKCSMIGIIKYMSECEELEKKKLIRCRRGDEGTSYRIPREVRESLRKSNEWKPQKNENLSISKFFSVIEQLFEERGNSELSYENLAMELQDLINMNMHLEFCKKIMSYKFEEDILVLLVCFCHVSGNYNDYNISSHDIEFLFEEKFIFIMTVHDLTAGCHVLIESKTVEYADSNGFADSDRWKLSDKAKKEFLSELKGKRNYKKDLVSFDKIVPKKMFYNARETGAIQKLTALLQEENYRKIVDRLEGKGMRKGFACLFSGGPGTGKTETAYQIARETKRNIMLVDISATKSKWYGESEKKIKEIFNTYRTAVDSSEIAPILLFNEADAVIGKRKEINGSNGAVDQTENTIQNIILQEMENLSGILIATTNLTQNMDSAFERRFLYKIAFDKPCVESRKGIWNSLLPELPEEKTTELSGRFETTGGQIENIARKLEVDAVLSGDDLSTDKLIQYCKDEMQNSLNTAKRIGFADE